MKPAAGSASPLFAALTGEIEGVDAEIHANDGMYEGNAEHYFRVGQSAVRNIALAMLIAQRDTASVQRILDFGCGYGRVLRTIRKAFPAAELSVSDVTVEGVQYCARRFNAIPFDPSALAQNDVRFDLIWSGSVLTHLDRLSWTGILTMWQERLADDGLLVFSTHGREVIERFRSGWNYGLNREQISELISKYKRDAFGYVDYRAGESYGISLAAPSWVTGLIEQTTSLRLVGYAERAWDGHHDIAVCVRSLPRPVRGPGGEEFAPTVDRVLAS